VGGGREARGAGDGDEQDEARIDHPDTMTTMNGLAFTWKFMGRHDDALRLLRACFDMRHRKLGIEHPDTVSTLSALTAWQSRESKRHFDPIRGTLAYSQ